MDVSHIKHATSSLLWTKDTEMQRSHRPAMLPSPIPRPQPCPSYPPPPAPPCPQAWCRSWSFSVTTLECHRYSAATDSDLDDTDAAYNWNTGQMAQSEAVPTTCGTYADQTACETSGLACSWNKLLDVCHASAAERSQWKFEGEQLIKIAGVASSSSCKTQCEGWQYSDGQACQVCFLPRLFGCLLPLARGPGVRQG